MPDGRSLQESTHDFLHGPPRMPRPRVITAIGLETTALENHITGLAGGRLRRGDQARLADAGLATQQNDLADASRGVAQDAVEKCELTCASDHIWAGDRLVSTDGHHGCRRAVGCWWETPGRAA